MMAEASDYEKKKRRDGNIRGTKENVMRSEMSRGRKAKAISAGEIFEFANEARVTACCPAG
jgi:hypothetical protein